LELKRGTLRAFNAETYKARVQVFGSRQTDAELSVSRAIPEEELLTGRSVGIMEFWPGDPTAAVVAAVW
jgi:hypothetical protein